MATDSIHKPARAPWLPAVVDFTTDSHARAVAVLIVVTLLAFLPGFFQIGPVDRDEARFAQATKQMIETGDYVDIRFQDETRYKKPIGIYWLQAAAVKLARTAGLAHADTTIWLYRIPSLLGAIGAVLATYWAALAFVSRRAAVLAGIMMAVCILLGVEARLAKTDASLLLTCVVAMGALGRIYLEAFDEAATRANPWVLPAIFWTALAGGILLKGPLILMFAALTVVVLAVLDRSAGWLWRLKPLAGIGWLLLLVLPWFIAIVARYGGSFFEELIGHDLAAKIGSGQETHGAPPGTYFVLFWVTFFPGSILAGLATPAVIQSRREPATKFLLAWLVPAWIVFEARDDQAAALRAAALSGDRDPDCRGGRPRCAFAAALAAAGNRVVVPDYACVSGPYGDGERLFRAAGRPAHVAVPGCRRDFGVWRLVALSA